jgi:chromosome segregation ATPase
MIKHLLNFDQIQGVLARIRGRYRSNQVIDAKPMIANVIRLERQIDRLLKAYQVVAIEVETLQEQMDPLRKQKQALTARIDEAEAALNRLQVNDDEIKRVLDHLGGEIEHADIQKEKRVVQTLFQEILVFPKEGDSWKRIIEIKGTYVPLTRVFVASPRGFEPLSPA